MNTDTETSAKKEIKNKYKYQRITINENHAILALGFDRATWADIENTVDQIAPNIVKHEWYTTSGPIFVIEPTKEKIEALLKFFKLINVRIEDNRSETIIKDSRKKETQTLNGKIHAITIKDIKDGAKQAVINLSDDEQQRHTMTAYIKKDDKNLLEKYSNVNINNNVYVEFYKNRGFENITNIQIM